MPTFTHRRDFPNAVNPFDAPPCDQPVHEATQRIDRRADRITAQSVPDDELGHPTHASTALLDPGGVVRMLHPHNLGATRSTLQDSSKRS